MYRIQNIIANLPYTPVSSHHPSISPTQSTPTLPQGPFACPVGSRLCRGSFAVAVSQALVRGLERDEFFFTPRFRYCLYIALAHSRNYGLPALPRAFFCLRIRNPRLTEGFLGQQKTRNLFGVRVLRFNANSIHRLSLSRQHRLLHFGEHRLFQPRSPVKRQRRQ
jgi:hypothetical protein